MGSFSYLCSACHEPINSFGPNKGEKCVLIHMRHMNEIGRTTGHYAGFGNVAEDDLFCSTDDKEKQHPNSHSEICVSSYDLEDSLGDNNKKMIDGEVMSAYALKSYYSRIVGKELYQAAMTAWENTQQSDRSENPPNLFDETINVEMNWYENGHPLKYKNFLETLDDAPIHSGIIACHSVCYNNCSPAEQSALPISKRDPNQGFGEINPMYE